MSIRGRSCLTSSRGPPSPLTLTSPPRRRRVAIHTRPRREHRAFTPLGEQGPFPAAHPARDTCSSRARGPGKSDSRVLGADRRVWEVAGPCTPKPQGCQSSEFGLVPPGVVSDASRTHIAESVRICIPAVLRQDLEVRLLFQERPQGTDHYVACPVCIEGTHTLTELTRSSAA